MCKYTVRGWHCRIKVVLLCLICKICKSHCVCLVCGARRLPLGQPSGTRCQRTRALSKNLTKQTCLQPEALTATLFLSRSLIPYYCLFARMFSACLYIPGPISGDCDHFSTHSHTDTLCECSKYCDFWISTQYLSQSLCPCVASCSQ